MKLIERISLALFYLLLVFAGCQNQDNESTTPETNPESSKNETQPESEIALEDANQQDSPAIRFKEVTADSGIDFTYRNGEEANRFSILESLGGGVAVFDFDLDQQLDLFFAGGGQFGPEDTLSGLPGKLYRQTKPFEFQEITSPAGCNLAPVYNHGAIVSDYDNDGFPDLLVTGYGQLLLLHNQGDGTFLDVTESSGVIQDTLWSSSAAWCDLDDDGDLDLYVAHYVDWSFDNDPACFTSNKQQDNCPPRDFQPLPDILFMNNGDGTFSDRSQPAGLSPKGKGLGVVAGDIDLDGDMDLYVTNDEVPNFLYRNDGTGKLQEVALMTGTSVNNVGTPEGSMGVDLADINLDGLPDLWCVNFENESLAMYRNDGDGFFQYVSHSIGLKGITQPAVSWGTAFFDADCDLDEDVVVSNGHVLRFPANAPLKQKPFFLENIQGQRFRNISQQVGDYFLKQWMGRGLGLGDFDDDGYIDLAFCHMNEPVALLKNMTDQENHWVGFRLIGRTSPRDAIGALVKVDLGNKVLMRQIKGGGSYASTNDLRVHFGLSDYDQIKNVTIHWPTGGENSLGIIGVDTYHTIIEPR